MFALRRIITFKIAVVELKIVLCGAAVFLEQ